MILRILYAHPFIKDRPLLGSNHVIRWRDHMYKDLNSNQGIAGSNPIEDMNIVLLYVTHKSRSLSMSR
jgi:hypothetical protein